MADDTFAEAPVGFQSSLQQPQPPSASPSNVRTPSPTRSKRLYAIRAAEIQMQNQESVLDEQHAERRERDAVRGAIALKASMIVCMLFAGALGGFYAYKLGADSELAEFRSQYYSAVSQVQYSLQRGLSAKAGAGALAAAYFASAGSNFPNASYPGWNAIAYNLNIVAQVRGIAWLPLVTPAQLPGWQVYANDTVGVQWAIATLQQCGFVNATDYAAGQATVARNIRGGLFAGNASVHKPINASAAYYLPLIHHAPIHTNEAVIMYDLNSEPVRARAISQVIATQAAATTDWLRLVQDTNANLNRIASLALTPVVVNGVTVGISNTVFNWDTLLLQALPNFVTGIHAVLSSQLSNRTFTMLLSGGSVQGVGVGDLHETDAELTQYSRSVSATLGTTWTVTLYPTRALVNSFRTTGPRDRCIAVLVVIIVCILLFLLHDWLARTRSFMLVRLVQATSRIVDDVFPKSVRQKMMAQALEKTSPPHVSSDAPLSQGAAKALTLIQKFVGMEAAQTRAVARRSSAIMDAGPSGAIAESFPAVTIIFTDCVGFTAWSASVTPDVVFRVLGAMFREFDELAHTLGIFKVETIGDAYMAVCGLPEPTPFHAERMADFALGLEGCVARACAVTGAQLQIRIGLHSGSVTAGVLMGERSRFQLFGDAVNTASRMESTGLPGRIQVSETTAALLRAGGCHSLEHRGKVAAKGKGELDTYWLLHRTQGQPWRAPSAKRVSASPMGLFSSLSLGRRESSRSSTSSARGRGSVAGDGQLAEVLVAQDLPGESGRPVARTVSYAPTPTPGGPGRTVSYAPTPPVREA